MNTQRVVLLSTPNEMLEKLKAEFEDFKNDPSSARFAINFVLTACHLTEWVWKANLRKNALLISKISNLIVDGKSFKEFVEESCIEMKCIRNLANSSKHFYINDVETSAAFTWESEIKWEEANFSWDYAGILIKIDSATWVSALEVFQVVLNWWEQFFKSHISNSGNL